MYLFLCLDKLKTPSKWENCALIDLICFFQHNYLPTFEQCLWDMVICVTVEGTAVRFVEGHDHFISNTIGLCQTETSPGRNGDNQNSNTC